MYCAKCKILMAGETPIQDPEGWEWPYDFQLCTDCRTSDTMSEGEVQSIIDSAQEGE